MRDIILYIAASLDGYIARSDGAVDWLDKYHDADYGYRAFDESVDTVLWGYTTYAQSLSFGEDVFAGKEHYVFTRRHDDDDWGPVTFVREDAGAFVQSLKMKPGKNIWLMGGGKILTTMLQAELVDEMMIFVMPELIGDGIPLFPSPGKEGQWALKNSRSFGNGVVLLHYANTGNAK